MKRLKLFAASFAAAILAILSPVSARAAVTPLEELAIIDAPGEEDASLDVSPAGAGAAAPLAAAGGDMIIAIDPGHGGGANGAVYGGINEKDINLKIARYLRNYLEEYVGVQVYMTRDTDVDLGLAERAENSANAGADVFISIHNNASTNAGSNGSMVFCPNDSYRPEFAEEGAALGESILSCLEDIGLANQGTRTRDSGTGNKYDDGSIADYYGVIRNAKLCGIPGIIVEHAFLSNEEERINYLSTDAQLRQLAKADADGIAEYYGLSYNGLNAPAVTLSAGNQKKLNIYWDEQAEARGYIVYRSEKKDGTYERIGKTVGSDSTAFTDSGVKQGQKYYYKIRAYGKAHGEYYYSEDSDPIRGVTIGGSQLTDIKQVSSGYFYLRWTPYEEGDGYAIYRSADGGPYERVATISDPGAGDYRDREVEPGVNYAYKIRTINTLYGNEGFGLCSKPVGAYLLGDPEMKRLDVRDDGTIKVVWTKAVGASRYVLQRSTSEDGEYQTIAEIADDQKNYYVDRAVERGLTYYYKVNAYNQHEGVRGSTGWVDDMGARNFLDPAIEEGRVAKSRPAMYIKWSQVPGADGYRIYRNDGDGYKKVATLKGGQTLEFFDETDYEPGAEYGYKVKAYVYNSRGTSWSDASDARTVTAGWPIMGKTTATAEEMADFFIGRGGEYPGDVYSEYGAPELEDFCGIVYEEAVAENVRAEVVFAQVCKETGFMRFDGDVEPEQCNFSGIGATGGVPGESFDDVRTGIRAQVQHLKAYACDEPLNQECVDPRFEYVTRGSAIYVEWLGIHENPAGAGWATGRNYGYSLRDDYLRPLLAGE